MVAEVVVVIVPPPPEVVVVVVVVAAAVTVTLLEVAVRLWPFPPAIVALIA